MNGSSVIIPMGSFDGKLQRPVFTEGNGIWLTDVNGKIYLDAISGIWNVSFGYGNKTIIRAITEQAQKIPFTNLYVSPADITVEYAAKLLKCLNGDFMKLIYTCSGSESVELSMKICRKYQSILGSTKRTIGVLDFSYHGTTYGAMSLSGIDKSLIADYLPGVSGIEFIEIPYGNIDDSEAWIESFDIFFGKFCDSVAGVIVEPVIGSGGVIEIPPKAFEHLRHLCDVYSALFVADEVATGFGRTGKMFAYQYSNVVPDIICVSKCINSGYLPLGAVLINEQVTNKFVEKGAIIEHFSTQNGNPIACRAADAVLNMLNKDKSIFDDIVKKGEYLYDELLEKIKLKNISVNIRYKGLMLAIDLKNKDSELPISEFELEKCISTFYKRGLIVHPYYNSGKNSGFMLFPSFISTYDDLDTIIKRISNIMNVCLT